MVSPEVLSQAAKSFGFDTEALQYIGKSCNVVYKFIKGNKTYYLRFSEKPVEFEIEIQAEVHWVRYLAENGVRVALPIHTLEGELTTVCNDLEKYFIVTVFEEAPGHFFDSDPKLWGPNLFHSWGETMGSMHRLTKTYDPGDLKFNRMNWRPAEINNPHLLNGHYGILLHKLREKEKQLTALPKSPDSYGLIHYDFHPYNFLIEQGEITVFDFDDALYGWFALDIGISATHAVWWGAHSKDRESQNEFAKHFLNEFLEGYIQQNHIGQEWIRRIPMFMEYRNIHSFFWWLNHWDGKEEHLTESQRNAITEAVKLIEREVPFAGCDFEL